jgi:hypothetical protein
MDISRQVDARIQWEFAGMTHHDYGVDLPFPFASWDAANDVEIVDDGATMLISLITPEKPHRRLVTSDDSMLRRFLRLETAPVEELRDFVLRYGPLFICEHGMPNSHNRVQKFLPHSSTEHVCDALRRGHRFEEPVEVWQHFSRRAAALLELGAELHQNRPATADHWDRLPYADSDDYDTERVNGASGLVDLDKQLLAGELSGWLEGGGVVPVVEWATPGEPSLRFRPEGLFGAIGLQLATRVGRIPPTAECSSCGIYYERTGRAPKRGQRNYCPACKTTGPSRMYKRAQRLSERS